MNWLHIRKWDHWQTYRKDREQPPWIKLHRRVMRNPDWVGLNDAERGQLTAIWLLAADHDGWIPADARIIQKLCYMDSAPDLEMFINQGFIDPDQSMAPERRQDDAKVASSGSQHDAPEENRVEKKRKEEDARAARFARFWSAYPVKKSKGQAEKSWKKLNPDDELVATMLAALERQQAERQAKTQRGEFVPEWKHPATWLNGRCWEDEPEKPAAKRKDGPSMGNVYV